MDKSFKLKTENQNKYLSMMDNLGVKRVPFEVILALELVGVGLAHDEAVLVASIDICLVHFVKTAPREVPFSSNYNNSLPFPVNSKSCCVLLVCVLIDHLWQPQYLDVLLCESIQGIACLEVLVFCPVLVPDQSDLKLNLNGVVFLVDVNQLVDFNRG